MLTKKQIMLLKPFQGANILKEYGVRELARAANEKSNNAVQIALRQFLKENIVVERKQTKKSDLDIAVFIPDKSLESNIKIASNTVKTSTLLPLHIEIITNDEFFEMLINKETNVGKEIAKKHRAVHNTNIFYKIIKKALDNGFKY